MAPAFRPVRPPPASPHPFLQQLAFASGTARVTRGSGRLDNPALPRSYFCWDPVGSGLSGFFFLGLDTSSVLRLHYLPCCQSISCGMPSADAIRPTICEHRLHRGCIEGIRAPVF